MRRRGASKRLRHCSSSRLAWSCQIDVVRGAKDGKEPPFAGWKPAQQVAVDTGIVKNLRNNIRCFTGLTKVDAIAGQAKGELRHRADLEEFAKLEGRLFGVENPTRFLPLFMRDLAVEEVAAYQSAPAEEEAIVLTDPALARIARAVHARMQAVAVLEQQKFLLMTP